MAGDEVDIRADGVKGACEPREACKACGPCKANETREARDKIWNLGSNDPVSEIEGKSEWAKR